MLVLIVLFFSEMYISYYGIILDLFSITLYFVVQTDGMVCAGVWCVPILGSGVLILCSTLGGVGVSSHDDAGSLFVY